MLTAAEFSSCQSKSNRYYTRAWSWCNPPGFQCLDSLDETHAPSALSSHTTAFLLSQAAGRSWCIQRSNQLQYRPQHSPRCRNVAYSASLGIAIRTLVSPVVFPSRERSHSLGNAETSEKLCALGKKVDHWWATKNFLCMFVNEMRRLCCPSIWRKM